MSTHSRITRLFDGPIVRVAEIRWSPRTGERTGEYVSPWPEITFMRRGMFRKERHEVAADTSTLMLFNHRETYRMVHPVSGPCVCTALFVEPETLARIVRDGDRRAPERLESLLSFQHCPGDDAMRAAHYAMLARLHGPDPVEPLALEEDAIGLIRRIVRTGQHATGARPPRHRGDTTRAHRDAVEAVKRLLATRYRERLSLESIARSVHVAPSHLCRIFRAHTGSTMHRCLTDVRLAEAYERVRETDEPLAALAAGLGFAGPSHFSTAFRRAFRISPSRVRRATRGERAGRPGYTA